MVNTLEDEWNGDGDCSLREAVTAADDNVPVDTCPAGDGLNPDTIRFSVDGTITLGSTLPDITDPAGLTIDGSGLSVTVSGSGAVRVMVVDLDGLLTVAHLIVANGFSDSVGGGIFNAGTLTVTHSTFFGNSAPWGGGIHNRAEGTLTITHSTFSGNSAGRFGGGIFNLGDVDIPSTLNLTNTIIAGSRGGDCHNNSPFGTVNSSGVNLIEDGSCDGNAITGDPRLAPLADNGGPTLTHALCKGRGEPNAVCTGPSPAIDAADDAVCLKDPVNNTDQRGATRPQGNHCDIGAFEVTVDLDLLAFFDQAVTDGDLMGNGPGNSGSGRLGALRNMIATALELVAQGATEKACGQFRQAYLRTDGLPMLDDFASGAETTELATRIHQEMDALGCP